MTCFLQPWPLLPMAAAGRRGVLTRSSGKIAVLIRAGRAPVLILATICSFCRSTASVWSLPDTATYMNWLSGVGVIQLALGPISTAPMYFRSGRLHP